jgi:Carboxypeptidase regulatory-like domain
MRKLASIGLMITLAMGGVPSGLLAASQAGPSAAVAGTVRGSNTRPIAKARVQVRNVDTGNLVGTTTTDEEGAFAISGLSSGNFVVEVIDATGKILGVGTPFSLGAGATASTTVVAAGAGAAAAAASTGGFSLFGLGPVTSIAVLGAASAAAVTAVVATRPDASPSR